jgi:ERF superfamily protein
MIPDTTNGHKNGTTAMETVFGLDAQALQELHVQRELLDVSPYNTPMSKLVKAFKLVERGQVVAWGPGVWQVQGSQAEPYRVTHDGCTCKASQVSQKTRFACAHAVAAELFDRWTHALADRQSVPLPLPPTTVEERLAVPPPEELPMVPEASPLADDVLVDDTPVPAPGPAPAGAPVLAPPLLPPIAVPCDQGERSAQIGVLMQALARAQQHMTPPLCDSTNPHYRTRYASLAAIRAAVLPALSAEGLALTQLPCTPVDGWAGITTGLWHGASGQYLLSTLRLPVARADAQGYGSALTYARRYALQALCAVAGDEDDDAEAARPLGTAVRPTQERAVLTLLAQVDGVHTLGGRDAAWLARYWGKMCARYTVPRREDLPLPAVQDLLEEAQAFYQGRS